MNIFKKTVIASVILLSFFLYACASLTLPAPTSHLFSANNDSYQVVHNNKLLRMHIEKKIHNKNGTEKVFFKLIDNQKNPVSINEIINSFDANNLRVIVVDDTARNAYVLLAKALQNNPGVYSFTFLPVTQYNYSVIADVLLRKTQANYFPYAPLTELTKNLSFQKKKIHQDLSSEHVVQIKGHKYEIQIEFDTHILRQGKFAFVTVKVFNEHHQAIRLGGNGRTFGYLIGIGKNKQIVKGQSQDRAPTKTNGTHTTPIHFIFRYQQNGFYKIFLKLNIKNTMVLAPFGIFLHNN